MNTRELEQLLGEWRDLTMAEREFITGDNWAGVHAQQKQKQELQSRIERTTAGARPAEYEAEYARRFRSIVAELVSLESANAALVTARRASVRAQLDDFDRTTEVLRGLNRAYGTAETVQWTSYS